MKNLILASDISLESGDTFVVIMLWALIVVGILVVASMIFATVTKIIVWATYTKYNKIECQKKVSAFDLTYQNLQFCNLPNVQVKKASWLRSLLGLNVQSYGNSYSAYRKTIFLRKNIIDKATITAVAISTQKVGHAVMDNNKQNGFYYRVKPFVPFLPMLVMPLMVVGLIVDFASLGGLGMGTFIFAIVSLVVLVLSLVILILTIPIEKKANAKAIEILKQTKFATEQELQDIKKVHNAYILSYIADLIYALVQIVWDIVRILLRSGSKGIKLKRK